MRVEVVSWVRRVVRRVVRSGGGVSWSQKMVEWRLVGRGCVPCSSMPCSMASSSSDSEGY